MKREGHLGVKMREVVVLCLFVVILQEDGLHAYNYRAPFFQRTEEEAIEIFRDSLNRKKSYPYWEKRIPACQRWNEACIPWTDDIDSQCCSSSGLTCRCNLWFQNCRCGSRLWGK